MRRFRPFRDGLAGRTRDHPRWRAAGTHPDRIRLDTSFAVDIVLALLDVLEVDEVGRALLLPPERHYAPTHSAMAALISSISSARTSPSFETNRAKATDLTWKQSAADSLSSPFLLVAFK